MKTGCVILAGGKGSRMGADKALLEMNGEKFIKRLMNELDGFEEKLIARGSNSQIPQEDWLVIPDIFLDRGSIGGLHAALSKCKSDALFCVTCDMPLFRANLAETLCAELDETCDAVIAVGEDGRKHPLCGVYRKSMASVLERQILAGNNRMMRALDQMRVKTICFDSEESVSQLKNVNTPEDYLEIQKDS